MKLAITGGGGVRAPLLVSAALRRAGDIHLEGLSLLDIDARRLELIDGLCKELARQMGSPVRVVLQGKEVGADLCVRLGPVCPPWTCVSAVRASGEFSFSPRGTRRAQRCTNNSALSANFAVDSVFSYNHFPY